MNTYLILLGLSAIEQSINITESHWYEHNTQEVLLLFNIRSTDTKWYDHEHLWEPSATEHSINRHKLIWSWTLTRTICHWTFYQQAQIGMIMKLMRTVCHWTFHQYNRDDTYYSGATLNVLPTLLVWLWQLYQIVW